MSGSVTSQCACGRVAFQADGAPILSAICYCEDCQAAAREIEALPGAVPVADADGGTAYVLYRKDRVRCIKGAELLTRRKLREASATNRAVASCCNSAVLLDFDDSKHWVDLYHARIMAKAPPVEMRVQTSFVREGVVLPKDKPVYPGYPARFILKLLAARLAMLFRA